MRGISHRRYLWLSSIHDTIIYQHKPIVKPLSTLSLQFVTILNIDKFVANWYKFDGVFFAFFLKGQWRYEEIEWERDRGMGSVHEAVFELGTLEAQLQHAHGAIVADSSNSYELVSFHTIPHWLVRFSGMVWGGPTCLLFFSKNNTCLYRSNCLNSYKIATS